MRLSSLFPLSRRLKVINHPVLPWSPQRIDFFPEQDSTPEDVALPEDAEPTQITLIDYSPQEIVRVEIAHPDDCHAYLDADSITWVDVGGLGSASTWSSLAKMFQLHPLALEDILHIPQRPRLEIYDHQLVVIAHMVSLGPPGDGFISEQVSLIMGKNYLLSVQEEPDYDAWEAVRERLRSPRSPLRKAGVDYLLYALFDGIIDGFFPILEVYGDRLESLELEILSNPNPFTLNRIHQIKRELMELRRILWPQRDVLNSLMRDGDEWIGKDVHLYLRDCYDHAIQVLDILETYREIASGLTDLYLSVISNRMNEIMKFLTVMSSIFIPLTFIAGVYGMNFNTEKSPWNMPELNEPWGYPLVWVVMLLIALAMVWFFHRRGWFQDWSTPRPPRSPRP